MWLVQVIQEVNNTGRAGEPSDWESALRRSPTHPAHDLHDLHRGRLGARDHRRGGGQQSQRPRRSVPGVVWAPGAARVARPPCRPFLRPLHSRRASRAAHPGPTRAPTWSAPSTSHESPSEFAAPPAPRRFFLGRLDLARTPQTPQTRRADLDRVRTRSGPDVVRFTALQQLTGPPQAASIAVVEPIRAYPELAPLAANDAGWLLPQRPASLRSIRLAGRGRGCQTRRP